MQSNGGVASVARGGRAAGDAAALRPRGRGPRRAVGRRARRTQPPHHVRHGRHVGRHRRSSPRRASAEASARDTWIGGYPLLAPMLDVHTIGAGGGSIAYVDEGGAFRVGPRSAGADPGPACYGQRRQEPTITDAHVVLGRLDPERFLGGRMTLDRDAAVEPCRAARRAARPRRSPRPPRAILTIANANMARAIRSRTIEKGHDPREFALVAFGGAGPAARGRGRRRARASPRCSCRRTRASRRPPGLLTSDLKYDQMRTVFQLAGRDRRRRGSTASSTSLEDGAARPARARRRARRGRQRRSARSTAATSARATSCA